MTDWVSFYDFKHSVIYVNARHRDVHYRIIAQDIRGYVPSPTAAVLDYGCGAGDLLRVLADLGARAAFTGCDVSTGMLAEAARRWPPAFGPAPALAPQDGARTPFADRQFDIITISAVLHHVPVEERQAVYRELGRVLKPGGLVVIVDSLQKGDRPEWDGLLDLFPHYFHEPYYADYVGASMESWCLDEDLVPVSTERAFLSKVAAFTK